MNIFYGSLRIFGHTFRDVLDYNTFWIKRTEKTIMSPNGRISHDALFTLLGRFLIDFQIVEAEMVELANQLIDADPEYISALCAELEFNLKARALDTIYTRFAQIHGLSQDSPHPDFHKLMNRIQKLASTRNGLVHSFYGLLVTVDGEAGLFRQPTKLKPSKGLREQEGEDILPARLEANISEIHAILHELNKYRLQAIDIKYTSE